MKAKLIDVGITVLLLAVCVFLMAGVAHCQQPPFKIVFQNGNYKIVQNYPFDNGGVIPQSTTCGPGLHMQTLHADGTIDCAADSVGGGGLTGSVTVTGQVADGSSHTLSSGDVTAALSSWLNVGVVDTNGTAVTWVSGAKFYSRSFLYGTPHVTINGSTYTVASVGAETGGSTTTLTLNSSAGVHSGVAYAGYGVGDEKDAVAVQEAVFSAYGIPGAENSNSSTLNKMLIVPCGLYILNRPFVITHVLGSKIMGYGSYCSTLKVTAANTPILITNGFSRTETSGVGFLQGASNTGATVMFDWDGDSTGWSGALQGDSFHDNLVSAEGFTPTALGLWIAPNSHMGSEMKVTENAFQWYSGNCYKQNGFNALNNVVSHNNWMNCSGDALYALQGNVIVEGNAFQNGSFFSTPPQTGFDIVIANSAQDISVVQGNRSESQNFLAAGNGHKVLVSTNKAGVLFNTWDVVSGGHVTSIAQAGFVTGKKATQLLFRDVAGYADSNTYYSASTPRTIKASSLPCDLGVVEPSWEPGVDVADGTCVWENPNTHPVVFANMNASGVVENNWLLGGQLNLTGVPDAIAVRGNNFTRLDWVGTTWSSGLTDGRSTVRFSDNQWHPNADMDSNPWSFAPATNGVIDYTHDMNTGPQCWTRDGATTGFYNYVCLGSSQTQPSGTHDGDDGIALIAQGSATPYLTRKDTKGSNIAGLDAHIAGGRGTGTGVGGDVVFDRTAAGGAGTTVNTTRTEAARITDTGLKLATSPAPTCDAAHRGTLNYVAAAPGAKDDVQVCGKDAGNAYAWRTIY